MSTVVDAIDSAAALKRDFDAAFAAPAVERDEQIEALVVLRVDAELAIAMRVTELAGLYECPPVQRLPGGPSTQLGVAGLRGNLTLILSLGAVLGRGQVAPGKWLALCRADRSVGFAFEALEGYVQLPASRIRRGRAEANVTTTVAEVVEIGGVARSLLNMAALLAASGLSQ